MSSPNGEEPPLKMATEPISIPSLPHDLVVSCLAGVFRYHYPRLSLVSKSFRSILASPELYQTRSLLNRTESCLHVCFRFPSDPNPRWFTLNKKESGGNLLVPVSVLNSPPVGEMSNLVAVGANIYAIRGLFKNAPFSNISFLDCRTHTWLEAPSMRLAHTDSYMDGRMYLAGSSKNLDSLNCVEFFNTETQTWKPVPLGKRIFNLGNMEGKFYVNMSGLFCKNELAGWDLNQFSLCMIDKISYCYKTEGVFEWSDSYTMVLGLWRKLEGLEGLPKFSGDSTVKLADYGGKMVVLWDEYASASGCNDDKMIWCAEISLERRNSEAIWGKVEWFDVVLTVPKSCKFVCAVTAAV